MDSEHYQHPLDKSQTDLLYRFAEIFRCRDRLNKKITIRYSDKMYIISCNEEQFLAYRINEDCGLHPGIPGWPVCIVSRDHLFDESGISDPMSSKLSIHDWLNIITNDDLELI